MEEVVSPKTQSTFHPMDLLMFGEGSLGPLTKIASCAPPSLNHLFIDYSALAAGALYV